MSRHGGRPGVVFDCNILVQALAFESGPAAQCVRLVETGRVKLFVSRATLAELRRVLGYEEVLSISENMTPIRIAGYLDRLAYRATRVRRVRHVFHLPRDPDDEAYVDLAIAARADFLVTRDKDLLSLASSHSATAKQFRRLTHPLEVLGPIDFLRRLEGP
ncbi:MAG TPA: putative toxin-antitoxin system toxin component, PIN family [Humisphaera sp.]|jgi:putative PIN family toxin of toxin-antitoxin system|nr:putative toxin-antitoxin system toxin component, PIN family [Humisphaera sp.]